LFVGNLVDVIVRCLGRDNAEPDVFLLSDGEDVSTPGLIDRMAKASGRKARLIPVPQEALRFLAAMVGKRDYAKKLLGSLTVNSAPSYQKLGGGPRYSLDEGMALTFIRKRDAKPFG
jgi:nucleoside-diphosphate-sugar epimerase